VPQPAALRRLAARSAIHAALLTTFLTLNDAMAQDGGGGTTQPATPATTTTTNELKIRVPPVALAKVGERLPQVVVQLIDDANKGVANSPVTAVPDANSFRLVGDTSTTDASGFARFDDLRILGRTGEKFNLRFVAAGTKSDSVSITLASGTPARIILIDQPPPRTVSDSVFSRRLKVKVIDSGGNALAKQEISAFLCTDSVMIRGKVRYPKTGGCEPNALDTLIHNLKLMATEEKDSADIEHRRFSGTTTDLFGPTVRLTSEDGSATFDTLGLSGAAGWYAVRLSVAGCDSFCVATTNPIVYDPDVSLDRNFVAVSAIKSIAGVIPDDEFFDIHFRLRLTKHMFLIAASDIALTSRGNDSVHSNQKRLTEATLALHYKLFTHSDIRNGVPERVLSLGPLIKVFNTFPYTGIHISSLELAGSPFQGSSLTVGPVFGLYGQPRLVGGQPFRPQLFNLYAEFYVRSETIDFFKSLNIRGSILLPAAHGEPLTSRIAIAVPVGTIHIF
jgi:hypothetical protein